MAPDASICIVSFYIATHFCVFVLIKEKEPDVLHVGYNLELSFTILLSCICVQVEP